MSWTLFAQLMILGTWVPLVVSATLRPRPDRDRTTRFPSRDELL